VTRKTGGDRLSCARLHTSYLISEMDRADRQALVLIDSTYAPFKRQFVLIHDWQCYLFEVGLYVSTTGKNLPFYAISQNCENRLVAVEKIQVSLKCDENNGHFT
jgi:hypothetical protein